MLKFKQNKAKQPLPVSPKEPAATFQSSKCPRLVGLSLHISQSL